MPDRFTAAAGIRRAMNAIRSALLDGCAGVSHAFCGRQGGVSQGLFASLNCGPGSGDDPAHVAENRARVAGLVGAQHVNTLYQIHSGEAVIAQAPWTRETAPKADGMASAETGLALGVLAADCAPVLFADPVARVVGAAHAGWKGALDGVVEATVAAMERLGAERARIVAAIGPCIGVDAYEVGPEFFDRFALANAGWNVFFEPSGRRGHWRFDLESFVLMRLEQARVGRFEALSRCTYAGEEDYFSFRRATHRAEPDYGRNLSAILLT